jgi:hypothetical protein
MAKSSENTFTEDFDLIAPSIWVYAPLDLHRLPYCSSNHIVAPQLVLLCSWTEAHVQHVAKYTKKYQDLFPGTPIMVITTSIKDLCFRTSGRKEKRLKPAVDKIKNYLSSNYSESRSHILMHVFSEGGSHKACEVAEAYYHFQSDQLPVSALYLDSTPGHPRYSRLCKAVNKSLSPTLQCYHVDLLLSHALVGCIWVFHHTFRKFDDNVIARTRRRIIDPIYWDLKAPRCYIYSKKDEIVSWKDISDHAKQSFSNGIPVEEKVFEDTKHVQHEGETYWEAVMVTWERAMNTKS